MSLIELRGVHLGVGGPALIEDAMLSIDRGERIAIVGRNGAGKSTLLRLLDGELRADDGEVIRMPGLRIARLAQEVPHDLHGPVRAVVAGGAGEVADWLDEFHRLVDDHDAPGATDRMGVLQDLIEGAGGWALDARVEQVITRLDLPAEARFEALSGGLKRRVLLGRALAAEPDLLLLDEPTNHLDIAAIAWMEEFLLQFTGALVFVTHDRAFLRALATDIVEIDRGALTRWPGDWDNYLRRKEERAHAEAQANALFDKKLAEEEVWIRQGIKARRTRDEGRVRRLEQMRRERAERRDRQGAVKLATNEAQQSGKKVAEAEDVSFRFGDKVICQQLSTTLWRGDKVGLVGPNGVGKTTLIRLLLGELAPQAGEVKLGTKLEVAYFDQYRAALREDWNALDNVAEGREFIDTGSGRKHVIGYLQDFLFTPERARAPITRLSGGERNRLLLAKLFSKPSNLLVMDEPTNDLDVETLELLEERLTDYPGTLLLVSHDREFLDRVVTSVLAFEGDGVIREYVGGYSDWLRQRRLPASIQAPARAAAPVTAAPAPAAVVSAPPKRKLSYKDQRELEQLPGLIEQLEGEVEALGAAMADPGFYAQASDAITAHGQRLAATQARLDQAYARWAELDA